MIVIRQDPRALVFRPLVQAYFESPLETLQAPLGDHDQASSLHGTAYAEIDEPFYAAYDVFLRRSVVPLLAPGDWLVQRVPTFRFHIPGAAATKEFHRDRDYGHPRETVNVIVPLTPMALTTSVWVERGPYVDSFEPMPAMQAGDFCIFDGANRRHGSYANTTMMTRVSFDCRLLQRRHLPPRGTTTANRAVPIDIGAYYREL